MVHLIAGAYARVRHLVPEIAKFGVVGAIGAVVDLGGTAMLYRTHLLGPLSAKAVAVICACMVTYLGNRFWTFRHRDNQPLLRETTLFVVLNVVGLLIAEVVIAITAYAFGAKDQVAYNLASVIGTGLGTIFRFWAYRKWVFLAPLIPNEHPVPAHHDPTVAAGQSAPTAPGMVNEAVNGRVDGAAHGANGSMPNGSVTSERAKATANGASPSTAAAAHAPGRHRKPRLAQEVIGANAPNPRGVVGANARNPRGVVGANARNPRGVVGANARIYRIQHRQRARSRLARLRQRPRSGRAQPCRKSSAPTRAIREESSAPTRAIREESSAPTRASIGYSTANEPEAV